MQTDELMQRCYDGTLSDYYGVQGPAIQTTNGRSIENGALVLCTASEAHKVAKCDRSVGYSPYTAQSPIRACYVFTQHHTIR
jgi:hypothetical protein